VKYRVAMLFSILALMISGQSASAQAKPTWQVILYSSNTLIFVTQDGISQRNALPGNFVKNEGIRLSPDHRYVATIGKSLREIEIRSRLHIILVVRQLKALRR
jgi:hypothetical protein